MGRKLSPEEIYKRARANGYKYAAHQEWVASVQSEEHDNEELLFDNEKVDAPRVSPPSLQEGLPSLNLATIKDFLRFYALGSDGRLDPRMTSESLNNRAERFFAGFTRITSSVVTEQDRSHIYNYLLTIALADGALYGIESIEDLWDRDIPDGDDALPLRWKDDVLELPVVRNATKAHGVTNIPLPKLTFERILKSVLNLPGYFGTATIHAIRRALGKKVDERYTEVQSSQHINQSDPRVYGQSYVANTSSVEDEEGFSQFRGKGLPRELPAKEKARINEDPQLLELQKRVQLLQRGSASGIDIKNATNEARNHRTRIMRNRLAQFQLEWIWQRRDWKIDTRGKESLEDDTKTDLENTLSTYCLAAGKA
ncbi:MAG: hypothetical protein Q9164_001951 [Protoblastenia rupestris]